MQDNDYVGVRGPSSLAEVVSVIDPNAAAPQDDNTVAYVDIGTDVFAAVQYDAVDEDTYPYFVTVESAVDGKSADVRRASRDIVEKVKAAGWQFRLTSDLDDAVLAESAVAAR